MVISAGQPRDTFIRVREVAVLLHDVPGMDRWNGILYVYDDQERTRELARLPIRDTHREEDQGSVKIYTNLTFPAVSHHYF